MSPSARGIPRYYRRGKLMRIGQGRVCAYNEHRNRDVPVVDVDFRRVSPAADDVDEEQRIR